MFPVLRTVSGPLSRQMELLASVVAVVPLERILSARRAGCGRPARDRAALVTAFLAKAILNLPTTRDLIGWWLVDWPDADEHFSVGIGRLTRIDVAQPLHMRLLDDKLFDYPWIYITQAGWWNLSDKEILRLREYLTRGGFLMTDDFWGPDTEEWRIFSEAMHRALPGHAISDISENDPAMHVLYDIREKDRTFIPGSRHLRRGSGGQIMVQQPFGTTPAWRAMYDHKNRMVVAANYNTDIGDAWEWADSPVYPEQMTALAYRYGINYIIYAMTH